MTLHENYSLLPHNTFGLDVRCKVFAEYTTLDELRELLNRFGDMPRLHIGGGSNLLFTKDFDGLILHSAISDFSVTTSGDDVLVRAGAGLVWDDFVARCTQCGYYGLENLSYIPGEVGASAVQNIGAYGDEVASHIALVEAYNLETQQVEKIPGDACHYGYRTSNFKSAWRGKYVVTHVVFRLKRTFTPALDYRALAQEVERRGFTPDDISAAELRDIVISIRREKLPEPKEVGSAGSFFVNPVVTREKFDDLLASYPEMPHYLLPNGSVKIPAGWLIQKAGWRGKSLGRAGVWPKQALVLVNLGGATGEEIVRLAKTIVGDVEARFGITLKPEVNFM